MTDAADTDFINSEDTFGNAVQRLENLKQTALEYASVGDLHNAVFEELAHSIEQIIKDITRE